MKRKVIFLVFVIALALTVAVPAIAPNADEIAFKTGSVAAIRIHNYSNPLDPTCPGTDPTCGGG
jgi:hypothetical protein